MLKNILELEGAQKMSKDEQRTINGGKCGKPYPGKWNASANGGSGGQEWHQDCSWGVHTFVTDLPYIQ